MLPPLQAERQLLAIEAASVPHLTDEARRKVIGRHQRRVNRDDTTTKARSAHEALLATGRIPVLRVPARKQQQDGATTEGERTKRG